MVYINLSFSFGFDCNEIDSQVLCQRKNHSWHEKYVLDQDEGQQDCIR